jgi:transcriptional regulator with XRE-family HTH domain
MLRLDNDLSDCYNGVTSSVQGLMKDKLRRVRELRALSQRELAARARLSVTTINRIECGQCKPMPRTVRKLAQALNVSTEELVAEQPRLLQ